MGGQLSEQNNSAGILSVSGIVSALLVLSLFWLPPLPVPGLGPNIQVTEMLLPVLAFILLFSFKQLNLGLARPLLIILAVYAGIIFLSIAVNSRLGMMRDHFEIFKLVKYVLVAGFFFLLPGKKYLDTLMTVALIGMALLNFLHYINFMNFNQHIQVFYGNEIHVLGFGLNSLGEPDTKRILGTAGNPNINALLFLFFVIYFMPASGSSLLRKILFYVSVLGVLACQSRTGFIALGIVYVLGAWILSYDLKTWLMHLASFILFYLFLYWMGNIYLASLAGNPVKQGSVMSRMETWSMLWDMIKQKPLLGWSPYKEFIAGKVYPEGEYVFITWKYGFIGLLIHLYWLGWLGLKAWKDRMTHEARMLLLFLIAILIASITNTPTTDQQVFVILAMLTGLYFNSATTSKA